MTRFLIYSIGFLGLIASQAYWLRRTVPRLQAPDDSRSGLTGHGGKLLDVLVLGESSAIAVGASTQAQGLAGQLAAHLARGLGRQVRWRAVGIRGGTLRRLRRELRSASLTLKSPSAVVVSIGVNDALRLRRPRTWLREMRTLIHELRVNLRCDLIVLAPVPPLWKVHALPQPLRSVLGLEAFLLDRKTRRAASTSFGSTLYVPIPLGDQARELAADRFHPSPAGYGVIAAHLGDAITRTLQHAGGGEER